ncbi:hypothetical protein [Halorarius litoreus]|uniref:hypothetical protein n=1 Tax=Halorarius litoreus TaxID=2962676 RepID=UPI0020CC7A00|nr:hypothetical protein [Halorarius litoreus]
MRAALGLCLLLLLAGCNATAPETPTPETTAAPVPGAPDDYPPGIDASGVVDPVALANAHGAATGRRYVVVSNYTVQYPNGTLRSSVSQRSRVTAVEWTATVSVGGRRPGVISNTPATATFYSDGRLLVERIRRGNETKYLYIPPPEYNGGNGFYNSLRRPVPYRDPWALTASLDTRTLGVDNGSAVVAADGIADRSLFTAVVDVGDPANVSYRATVASTGLLRDQRLTYEGELFDGPVRVTRTISYRRLDGGVQRPPWFETAKVQSVRNGTV